MTLADAAIRRELLVRGIEIFPTPQDSDIRQCGIRVHLGTSVLVPDMGGSVAVANGPSAEFREVLIGDEGFLLESGSFALASTGELIRVGRHLLCSLDGRSTIARLGVFIHCSSSTIDNVADSPRSIVLELFNGGPWGVVLHVGDPIGQLVFSRLDGAIEGADMVQYAGQAGAVPPDTNYAFQRDVAALEKTNMTFHHAPPGYDCPFCRIVNGASTDYSTQDDVVFRDSMVTAFVASHWWPRNSGAVIIAVNRHIENVYELPEELGAAVSRASRVIAIAMKIAYKCDGTSTRQHNEPAGGQDVWHYHSHVFPRTAGDELYVLDREKRLAPREEKIRLAGKMREALPLVQV